MLDNLLGISDELALAREEERLTKLRAIELFDQGILESTPSGTFACLSLIHRHLFQDVYSFAGSVRQVDISKGGFRFASVIYLPAALDAIEAMPHTDFDSIVSKYVEMNIAHPFREGNGRSTRIWLDHMLVHSLGQAVNWAKIDKTDYLLAMERSPVKDLEIRSLLKSSLTDGLPDRATFMKGLDASYRYEGYNTFISEELSNGHWKENPR